MVPEYSAFFHWLPGSHDAAHAALDCAQKFTLSYWPPVRDYALGHSKDVAIGIVAFGRAGFDHEKIYFYRFSGRLLSRACLVTSSGAVALNLLFDYLHNPSDPAKLASVVMFGGVFVRAAIIAGISIRYDRTKQKLESRNEDTRALTQRYVKRKHWTAGVALAVISFAAAASEIIVHHKIAPIVALPEFGIITGTTMDCNESLRNVRKITVACAASWILYGCLTGASSIVFNSSFPLPITLSVIGNLDIRQRSPGRNIGEKLLYYFKETGTQIIDITKTPVRWIQGYRGKSALKAVI